MADIKHILPPGNTGQALPERYDCSKLEGCKLCCCEPIKVPFNDHVMAPFVEVKLSDGVSYITVGNNSSPPKNHAAIRSFKYGTTVSQGGYNCEIEITDEAGSDFQRFFDKISKVPDPKTTNLVFWINARWGWIGENCGGVPRVHSQTSHTFVLTKADVNYGNGVTSFMLKGTDMTPLNMDMINRQAFGTAKDKMSLKDAIRLLGKENGCDVLFMKPGQLDADAWEFVGGKGEPKAVWRGNGTNFLQTVLAWITPFKTASGNGISWSFNSRRPGGSYDQFILWEGKGPTCNEKINPCARSIGTYIVNGGNRSPVIDFKTNINWSFASIGAGGAMSPDTGADSKGKNGKGGGTQDNKPEGGAVTEGPECRILANPNNHLAPDVGVQTMSIVSEAAREVYGTRDALKMSKEALAAHSRVNTFYEPISAEMRVQGDPFLADPIFLRDKVCSIVVIQPFHVQKVGGGCGEWLQTESCNRILSNRNWRIEGCGHEIRSGTYITLLKVALDVPAVQLDLNHPLGGDGACGYIVP